MKSLLLLLILCPSFAFAQYQLVMISEKVYDCVAPYEEDEDGMIRVLLVSGAEISLPADQVDWIKTASLNGHEVPEKYQSASQSVFLEQLRRKLENAGGSGEDLTMPDIEAEDVVIALALLFGLFLLVYLIHGTVIYWLLRAFDEYPTWLSTVIWNAVCQIGVTILVLVVSGVLVALGSGENGNQLFLFAGASFWLCGNFLYPIFLGQVLDCSRLKTFFAILLSGILIYGAMIFLAIMLVGVGAFAAAG